MTASRTRGAAADPADIEPVDGVTFRHCADLESDLPAMWAVRDRARVADGVVDRGSFDEMANYYRHLERFDVARDLVLVEAAGGVVGFGRVEWNDSNDGERWYEGVGVVEPAWRRRGIGTRLLDWTERRRMEIAAEHAAAGEAVDRARALTTFLFDGDVGGRALLEGAGYRTFRRFATMRRPDLDDLPLAPLPGGFEIRPLGRGQARLRRVFDADAEAFQDHFGWAEASDEQFAAFLGDPSLDPSLWVVAFDGDEVAGACINAIHVGPDGERTAWLDSIFTRRPWRRRGLARALIAFSLRRFRDRGMTSASLGVDLTNPHQALALYESCGFGVVSSATAYRKPLEEVTR